MEKNLKKSAKGIKGNQVKRLRNGLDEKDAKALELRRQGKTYADIAAQCGWAHPAAAHKAVKRILDKHYAVTADKVDEYRQEDLARMDLMLECMMPHLNPVTFDPTSPVVDKVLKVMERRAKLMGLDSAQKIDANITGEVNFGLAIFDMEVKED